MKRFWTISAMTLVTVAFITTLSCKQEPKEIKIGAILPLTGDNAVYGVAIKRGIEIALAAVNENGGIRGRKLTVIFEDDQADPQKTVTAYNKLTKVDKVPMVLGGVFSASTLAIAPLAEKGHIILLSPTSSAVDITKAGDYIFRIYPSDSYDGLFLADFVAEKLKAKSVSILYLQVASISAISEVFKSKFESKGGIVKSYQGYKEGESDFRAPLLVVKQANPDVVFLPGYLKEMAIQLRQARELGLKKPIISISTFFDPKILNLAGNAAEGIMFSTPVFDPMSQDTVTKMFVESYSKTFKEQPNIWAGYGYDVLRVASYAIDKAIGNKRLTSDGIKDALYSIKDFPGVTGLTTFDQNGDVVKELRMMQVSQGKFVPLNR